MKEELYSFNSGMNILGYLYIFTRAIIILFYVCVGFVWKENVLYCVVHTVVNFAYNDPNVFDRSRVIVKITKCKLGRVEICLHYEAI